MTKQEYLDGIKRANVQKNLTIATLSKKYAEENNEICIGDIIESHLGRIRVESMKVYIPQLQHFPHMSYTGEALTKKNLPYKKSKKTTLYQGSDLIRHSDGDKVCLLK